MENAEGKKGGERMGNLGSGHCLDCSISIPEGKAEPGM
jgi:hypothetical protein